MSESKKYAILENAESHKGFIKKSGIFIFLTFMSSLFEIGFSGITSRLPDGGFATFGALFNLFFIVITPLTGIQFVVSKEIAAFISLNEQGKAKSLAVKSIFYSFMFTLTVANLGFIFSKSISEFLRIETIAPVILLMIVLLVYSPFPVFYGTIQGLKRFYVLGLVHFGWGLIRFLCAVIIIVAFTSGLNNFMLGVIGAVLISSVSAYLPLKDFFKIPGSDIEPKEITRALLMILPIIFTIFCVTVLKNIDIVFAKRFFDPSVANAYRCATLVGSGFFTLSGIIMVMFPHVSEEKTLNRNPVIFLLKSFAVTLGLGGIGLLIAFFAPGLVMRIITLGNVIPGAEPLIKFIGFAVLPVSLIYIMANYLLAKHSTGFLPILAAGTILQVVTILLNHDTPMRMLIGIGAANLITFAAMLIFLFFEHKKYLNKYV